MKFQQISWVRQRRYHKISAIKDTHTDTYSVGTYMLQVVLSQLTLAPESDSYLRDEEGSGSGHLPVTQLYDDGEADDSTWTDEGSASGDSPLPPGNM